MEERNHGYVVGRYERLDRRLLIAEKYGKMVIFAILAALIVFLSVTNVKNWLWIVPAGALLLIENAVKFWVFKKYQFKVICYVLDACIMLVLTYFSDGMLISTLYIILLSEFYLGQPHMKGNTFMFACNTVSYLAVRAVASALNGVHVEVLAIISNSVNDLFLLGLHFLIFNFVIQIVRRNKDLLGAYAELNASNEKLSKAYAELQEVTALEERQRIAKEIHDTAGHSITTVIMQTEAAKLLVESDPVEAKRRITAANLQAKHALEELRESVHLLSGVGVRPTLKEELAAIIHDSTDGTGIVIRSEIEDIALCDAKSRFICNTLKEGIANGLRHGGATAFWFELKTEGNELHFLLSDNGSGADEGEICEGFGLSGMRRRAESLGGSVAFETQADEGFEIRLVLPLDGQDRR